MSHSRAFLKGENGAVSVDFITLTAVLIGMAIGIILIFNDGTTNVATNISSNIASIKVGSE